MNKDTNSLELHNGKSKIKGKKVLKKTTKFWKSNPAAKTPFTIIPSKLSKWLEQQGYYSISTFGEQQIVQLIKNVAHIKSPMEVYNDALEYVKRENNEILEDCFRTQGENLLLSKKGTLGTVQKLTLKRYKDTEKRVRVFFQNTIVEISSKGNKNASYESLKSLDSYIFYDQIVKRDFIVKKNLKGDFKSFLEKITNSSKHFLSVCTAIGYVISNFKNPSLAKAVIITDILSQVKNEAYGRSGKGIVIKAISEIINVVEYNGKVTDLANDKFVFQNVDITTALIVLQDVTKGFVFESLFSTLTDTMSIERKHRSKIAIPFNESAKIALTTNYTIPQDTDSFRDRKQLVMLNNFFNANNKPEKYFKTLLFHWSKKEWQRFDNFMLECVRLFLEKGLVNYSDEKFELQRLINQTSEEFIALMESDYDYLNHFFSLKKIAEKLTIEGINVSVKSKIVKKWCNDYAAHKGYQIEEAKNGGYYKICFRPRPN
tara:strand:- start:191501 stop:192961 length:1461 start_codon:yes stop_codon:yes gene_type:complete